MKLAEQDSALLRESGRARRAAASLGADARNQNVKKKGTGGRPSRDDIEGRNSRILSVATDLFLQKGFSATSLGDIAVTAGVAKRTIYDWYGDKAAIFSAIIHSDAARIDPSTVIAAGSRASATTTLFRLAKQMRDVLLDPLTSSILRLMAGEAKKFPDIIASSSRESMEDMYKIVARTLSGLRDSQVLEFQERELGALAARFFDLVIGISSLRRMMEEDFTGPSDKELRTRVAMFLAYLAPKGQDE